MSQYCTNKPVDPIGNNKRQWSKKKQQQLSDLTKQVNERYRILGVIGGAVADEETARLAAYGARVAQWEETFVQNTGSMFLLDPSHYNRLENFLRSTFGAKRANPMNAGTNYNQAGEVAQNLFDSRRVAQNMVTDAGMLRATQRVNGVIEQLQLSLTSKGISTDKLGEILMDTIEMGNIPKLRLAFQPSDAIEAFQMKRLGDYYQRMDELGFDGAETDELVKMSMDVSATFDEMRAVADSVGYNIPELMDLGYFPRIATDDWMIRLKQQGKELYGEELSRNLQTGNILFSDWDKMRTTYWYVPSDSKIAASFLKITEDELNEMLLDPIRFRNWLGKNVTDAQLEQLFDSGVMAKLPMSGRETFEYFVDKFQLPYKGLNEMFKTNPREAIEAYANELKLAVGNHAMVKTVVSDGIDAGWVLPSQSVVNLPTEQQKNFVRLGGLENQLKQWYTPEELKDISNLYVHKTVADQWMSILHLSSSPTQMGNVAGAWANIATSILQKTTLLSTNVLYLGRMFLGAVISGHAAGANLVKLLPSIWDITAVQLKGLDHLDNTKPFLKADGKWLTKREAMETFILRRGGEITPGTAGVKASGGIYPNFNIKKAFSDLYLYSKSFGDPVSGAQGALEYGGMQMRNLINGAYKPIAMTANTLDLASKWMVMQSVLENPGAAAVGNTVGRVLSFGGKSFDNLEAAFRHIDEYFPMYDELGRVQSFVGKYVMPFGVYAMQNPPMMFRHALRHPQKYIAYHRLLQMYNQANRDDESVPEGAMPEYAQDEYPIVTQIDKSTGEIMLLSPNGYDPITESFTGATELGEDVLRLVGRKVGTTNEQITQEAGQYLPDRQDGGWLELLSKSYIGKVWNTVAGNDPITGEKRYEGNDNTYLGVPMSPALEGMLSFFPPIDALNRMNPGDVFGRKERRDAFGNVLVKSKSSAFGFARTENDDKKYAEERLNSADALTRTLAAFGARVRVVDTYKNMNYTYDRLERNVNDLEQKALQYSKEFMYKSKEMSEQDKSRHKERLEHMLDTLNQLKLDMARVNAWCIKRGIPSSKALQEMRDAQIVTEKLPSPAAPTMRKLTIESLRMREQMFGENHEQQIKILQGK